MAFQAMLSFDVDEYCQFMFCFTDAKDTGLSDMAIAAADNMFDGAASRAKEEAHQYLQNFMIQVIVNKTGLSQKIVAPIIANASVDPHLACTGIKAA